jgi:UDP-glucose 6-dehydrogenase
MPSTLARRSFAKPNQRLRESTAVEDTLYPDRIVIGSLDPKVGSHRESIVHDRELSAFKPRL